MTSISPQTQHIHQQSPYDTTKFRWNAHNGGVWLAFKGNEWLEISHTIYERAINRSLAEQGIIWRVWTTYMRENNESGWQKQCEEENRLREQYDFWRSLPGVIIHPEGER